MLCIYKIFSPNSARGSSRGHTIVYTNLLAMDSRVLILQGSDDDDDDHDDHDDEWSSLFAVSISTLCYTTALPMIKTRAGELNGTFHKKFSYR